VSQLSRVALDLGSHVTKVAVASAGTAPAVRIQPTSPGGWRAALEAALAHSGVGPETPVTLAVPDKWLSGSAAGGRHQEEVRHAVEDELGLRDVSWVGQLAAVAAVAASQRGHAESGTYLVCDVGGRTVRAAACDVSGQQVRQRAVDSGRPGGGWRDFDAAVRSALGEPAGGALTAWHRDAVEQERRARVVLNRAMDKPQLRDALAYTLGGGHELTAGQVIDCFAATADRIKASVSAVLSPGVPSQGAPPGGRPAVAVLAGGLAWLPLATRVLSDVAGPGLAPVVLGVDAAVTGALLLSPPAPAAPPGLPDVSLPMNEVRDGLLTEVSQPVPWTRPFACQEPLHVSEPRVTVDVGGRRATLPVPGLAPGWYRIGVRPAWAGTGVLVLRGAGGDIHVLPLDDATGRRSDD
jgi:hypothetical protein